MEIVSLVGTLSSVGGHHLHMSLSDKDGHVFGGHVFGKIIKKIMNSYALFN